MRKAEPQSPRLSDQVVELNPLHNTPKTAMEAGDGRERERDREREKERERETAMCIYKIIYREGEGFRGPPKRNTIP